MSKKPRSNRLYTQRLCDAVHRAYLKYPESSLEVSLGGGNDMHFHPDQLVITLHGRDILRIHVEGGKFKSVSVFDGGYYDFLGCCSLLTRERLNGLLDYFERQGILPSIRIFIDDKKSSTLIGDGDSVILFGRRGAKSVTFKCFSKSIQVLGISKNESRIISPDLPAKKMRYSQNLDVRAVRSQYSFLKSMLKDGREKKCILCDAHRDVIEAAHIIPFSENGPDHGGNGLFLCKNHHFLFDKYLWTIRPSDFSIVCASGVDINSLAISKNNASSGLRGPSRTFLAWRWDEFVSRCKDSYVVAMPKHELMEELEAS